MQDKNRVNISVSPDMIEAKYSDFAIIGKNALGFSFDFAQRVPGKNQVRIVSRIAMSPQHAKLVLGVLMQNIKDYEKSFGKINLPKKAKEEEQKGMIHFVK